MNLAAAIAAQKRLKRQGLTERFKRLEPSTLDNIIDLIDQGVGVERICQRCHCSKDTVSRVRDALQ